MIHGQSFHPGLHRHPPPPGKHLRLHGDVGCRLQPAFFNGSGKGTTPEDIELIHVTAIKPGFRKKSANIIFPDCHTLPWKSVNEINYSGSSVAAGKIIKHA